jgi:hypothetical protein
MHGYGVAVIEKAVEFLLSGISLARVLDWMEFGANNTTCP